MAGETQTMIRNLAAFWIFGLCNNYAYVIMLSAAEDIMDHQLHSDSNDNSTAEHCEPKIIYSRCSSVSTGAVLLADIIPSLSIKLIFPMLCQRLTFGARHFLVVFLQVAAYFVVAYSQGLVMSLAGVAMAALGSGLGEITYLSLSSHFPRSTISSWSSGTGGAGVIGSFAYAGLTEPKLANLSPRNAILVMLVVPIVFSLAYWVLMVAPDTVRPSNLLEPSTWFISTSGESKKTIISGEDAGYKEKEADSESSNRYSKSKISSSKTLSLETTASRASAGKEAEPSSRLVEQRILSMCEKLKITASLIHYMLPLGLVYFAEYLINQGLTEMLVFSCSTGFQLSPNSQYRWYQVLYQVGVFISRSSVNVWEIPMLVLYLLPVLQLGNTIFFIFDSIYTFIPHIFITFIIIFYEGLLGGAAYVNTFHKIHNTIEPDIREFALSIASLGDAIGITLSGILAIPLHNFVCAQQKIHLQEG